MGKSLACCKNCSQKTKEQDKKTINLQHPFEAKDRESTFTLDQHVSGTETYNPGGSKIQGSDAPGQNGLVSPNSRLIDSGMLGPSNDLVSSPRSMQNTKGFAPNQNSTGFAYSGTNPQSLPVKKESESLCKARKRKLNFPTWPNKFRLN